MYECILAMLVALSIKRWIESDYDRKIERYYFQKKRDTLELIFVFFFVIAFEFLKIHW